MVVPSVIRQMCLLIVGFFNDSDLIEIVHALHLFFVFLPLDNITQPTLLSMKTSIDSIIIILSYSARCFPVDALLAKIDVNNVKRDTSRIGERITVSDLNRGTLYKVNVTIVAVGSQRISSTPLAFTARTKCKLLG